MTEKDTAELIKWTVIGVGIYLAYQAVQGVNKKISDLTAGPAPGQPILNYLFGVGGQGTLDASGNFVPPA